MKLSVLALSTTAILSSAVYADPIVSVNSNEIVISTKAGSPVYAQILDENKAEFNQELSYLPNGYINNSTLITCSASCVLNVELKEGVDDALVKVSAPSSGETILDIKNDDSGTENPDSLWKETFDHVMTEYNLDANGQASLLPNYPANFVSSFYLPGTVTVQDITDQSPTSSFPNQYIPENGQSSDILHGGDGDDSSNVAIIIPVSGSQSMSTITSFSLSDSLYQPYLENNQNYRLNFDAMRSNIKISKADDTLSTLSVVKNGDHVVCSQNISNITSWQSMNSCDFKYQEGDVIGFKISYPELKSSPNVTKSAYGLIVDNIEISSL
ncbi:hypothetical protein GNP63_14325 [Aliivibrio fischeri]|uniref:hypothetical protein n=1 Tax=Aliivibrio fischeri TaxID=668 RepID=UPI0012D98854|nr:hypothetical protein [Aliivibrio fischeri]MUH97708.1 hypothetical protein [Aliivibrio fischeri]MUI62389.1 hypothetical protein [Aliivibrio fischeri]